MPNDLHTRIACLVLLFAAAGAAEPPSPERLDVGGMENFYRVTPRIYSGGKPEGEAAFAALKQLGIKTIVTVDGERPDVETAEKYGLRYVHLPIGYDGIPRDKAVRIVEAVRSLPGPAYVHCHHGKHRGPAAVAVCGVAIDGWDADRAVAWMKRAGTAPEYRGLFASVRAFRPPTEAELRSASGDAPKVAAVPDTVASMVEIDHRWDMLKSVEKSGFLAPPGHPEIDPASEARLLAEAFREFGRRGEVEARGPAFAAKITAAETKFSEFEAALRTLASDPSEPHRRAASAAFQAAGKSCTDCHVVHRDNIRR